ncbi:MAG: hypothetical protein BAJALOKI1v1_790011 [Promethearchaeota archaeon]|nr:MAG: hypothetical protein BAJALOKI1v1_790011 [Candidatus Lokiarchaeota archaeon]
MNSETEANKNTRTSTLTIICIKEKAEIYYFTGSGNSFAAARELAKNLNGKLISISTYLNREKITINTNCIGIVFPVYYATNGCSGIPHIVEKFLNKLTTLTSKYIVAVCTHNGNPGDTLENVQTIIESHAGVLAGGFSVQLYKPPSLFSKLKKALLHKREQNNPHETFQKQEAVLQKGKEKLNIISDYIISRKKGYIETRSNLSKAISAPFLNLVKKPAFSKRYRKLSDTSKLSFEEMIPFADKSFKVNEKCNVCGICAKICPVQNIKIINNKPQWQHECETCFACYVWCPQEAIFGEIVAYNERYHHPEISLSDMIINQSKY